MVQVKRFLSKIGWFFKDLMDLIIFVVVFLNELFEAGMVA